MALTAPVVTGYQPFWSMTGDKGAYNMPLSQGRAKDAWRIARVARGYPTRDFIAAMGVLLGAAPGPTITGTYPAVPMPLGPQQTVPTVTGVGDLGGLRTAVITTAINRASTAADVTELKRWFSPLLLEAGITYPARLGPGSGGMLKSGMSAFVGVNT